jgi:hypothetical protein
LKCLPSLTKESSFWIHGGMGLFDAQKVFWEAQGMKRRFSQEDCRISTIMYHSISTIMYQPIS